MADKSIVSNTKLDALAQAIATKGGGTLPMTVDEMTAAVAAISGEDLLQHRISGDRNYQYENDTITIITNSAFKDDSHLSHISFPAVTFIGDDAFRNTQGFNEAVVFPELTTLNPGAFQNSYIRAFTAPKIRYAYSDALSGAYVRTIDLGREDRTDAIILGSGLFAYSQVRTIVIRNNAVATLQGWCFCSYLTGIYVPDDLVETYKGATNWSSYADKFKPLSEYTG